jgi:hypothetical protein
LQWCRRRCCLCSCCLCVCKRSEVCECCCYGLMLVGSGVGVVVVASPLGCCRWKHDVDCHGGGLKCINIFTHHQTIYLLCGVLKIYWSTENKLTCWKYVGLLKMTTSLFNFLLLNNWLFFINLVVCLAQYLKSTVVLTMYCRTDKLLFDEKWLNFGRAKSTNQQHFGDGSSSSWHSTAMPSWNKAATAQLKLKIAEGVVPTNPAELTNDYISGTLSAILFPAYHLTGPNARASVIRRFRKAFYWSTVISFSLEDSIWRKGHIS